MRIISGERRGLRLLSPQGDVTRPTLDRVRESLFSIIAGLLPDARVLDVFAGAGGLGLESLSRGAQHAVFVESNAYSRRVLEANIRKTRYENRATVVARDWWSRLAQDGVRLMGPYDLIIADPPYAHGRDKELVETLAPLLVRPSGYLVLQGGNGLAHLMRSLEWSHVGLHVEDTRTYGKTDLVFFTVSGNEA